MLEGITAYSKRSEANKSLKFISFCRYPFKNHTNELIGIRSQRQRNEPLRFADSLDEPLFDNEGNSLNRLELIADENAVLAFEKAERDIFNTQIHNIFEQEMKQRLDERQANVIRQLYWEKKGAGEIAAKMGISYQRVTQIRQAAIRRLRNSTSLRELATINYYQRSSVKSCQIYGSTVERIVERRERAEQRKQQKVAKEIYYDLLATEPELAKFFAEANSIKI